jgi:RNA polymerase sigma-70 factor (ECF subfamily)
MRQDSELISAVLKGEKAQFCELVRRHQQALMRVSLRMTKDLSQAEDVVQEAFVKAFEKLHSFEGRSSFKSWLFQIAINTAKNKLRSGGNRETVSLDDVQLISPSHPEISLFRGTLERALRGEVDRLPYRQRAAVSLRIFEDLSFQEVAEVMACPYDTAKANYRHGLMALRHRLAHNPAVLSWMEAIRDEEVLEMEA